MTPQQRPLAFCLRIYLIFDLSFVSLLKYIFNRLILVSVLLVVRAKLGSLVWHAERAVVIIIPNIINSCVTSL
jgi:hypothetical protein